MSDVQVLWEILPRVSRNFSTCIKLLPQPIDERMMLAYLVFRFIDTIEDSRADPETKGAFFSRFIGLLDFGSFREKETLDFQKDFFSRIDFSYEKPLVENMDAMVRLFHDSPEPDRKSLFKYASLMSNGMNRYLTRSIETFEEQDEYCYYVAGVVAQLFNEFFRNNGRMTREDCQKLMPLARSYGLGLQKTNLLMDIAYDINDERKFWPIEVLRKHGINDYKEITEEVNRPKAMVILDEMIRDALRYLEEGLVYVKNLSKDQLKIRVFCLVPLFMALEHIRGCADNPNVFVKGKKFKLSKFGVLTVIFKSYAFGIFNKYLDYWFKSIVPLVS